ncbi:hypothetical protein O9853_15295 [Vibrio lentus]|nr:hypothetical protein [Vibrio lentus]
MKKVTLLAAAVALGLAGCGSDSPHTSNTPDNDGTPLAAVQVINRVALS